MNVAFFSDDASAGQAALLAGTILNRHIEGSGSRPGSIAGGARILDAVPSLLDEAAEHGRHLMAALPLAYLHDPAIRTRVDLAVVTFGPTPLAAARALEAMRRTPDVSAPASPPWLLPCCEGASAAAGLRTLPVSLTALRVDEVTSLRTERRRPALTRRAVGLAAALRIAAADPFAFRLEPGHVAQILFAAETAAEMDLRRNLLDLAADLDGDDDERPNEGRPRRTHLASRYRAHSRPQPRGCASRAARTVPRRTATSRSPAPRQAAACPCTNHG